MSVLDTACARVALSQSSEPAQVEFTRRRITALELELEILGREARSGTDHEEEIEKVTARLESERAKLKDLEERLARERALSAECMELRTKLREMDVNPDAPAADAVTEVAETAEAAEAPAENAEAAPAEAAPDAEALRAELRAKRAELSALQGESPMVLTEVDEQAVSTILAEWTGIPLGKMVKDEIASVLGLADAMKKRVVGQDHGIDLIARRITTARAALADPEKPIAVIMLAGPSGTGKTETALALAEQLYGTERNLVTINMSEFQEAHTVSTLKGAPPGYVGYGEGGVLTEAVRRKPYSVVLLDEVEKAHKDVHEIFFQVFDKGRMEDGAGRLIDFRNTVIILTTNVGDDEIMALCQDEEHYPDQQILQEAVRPAMRRVFPAALLGRLSIVPYYPLSQKALNLIVELKLRKIVKRVRANYRAELVFAQGARDEIIRRCDNIASGARLIDAIVSNDLLPEVSAAFLRNTMEGKTLRRCTVDAKDGAFTYEFENAEE